MGAKWWVSQKAKSKTSNNRASDVLVLAKATLRMLGELKGLAANGY